MPFAVFLFRSPLFILLAAFISVFSAAVSADEEAGSAFSADFGSNLEVRDHFFRSRSQFETAGFGRVAFLGGSITEMEGYRPMVVDFLHQWFPETEFDIISAGISSTCSTTGAFRLERDILSHGPIDMLFVEFAVNDNQDGFFDEETAVRGMEGVIRHIRVENPRVDIIMTYFVNEPIMEAYWNGSEAVSIAAHRKVAERYGVSSVNLAREVAEEIDAETLTWGEFGGVHPAERGNRLCTDMIESLLMANGWSETDSAAPDALTDRELPEPVDENSYFDAEFISPAEAEFDSGWEYGIPNWPEIPGELRSNFAGDSLLYSDEYGALGRLEFSGPVIAAYILAGPDAGRMEYRIDGGDWQSAELHHPYSAGLHYPRSVIFADSLAEGNHTLEFMPAEGDYGSAVRILQFAGKKAE